MNLKKYENAIEDLNRAIEIEPENIEGLGLRGETYRYQILYENAIADFTKVLEIDPLYEFAYFRRASTYILLKKYHEAINDYTSLLNINPNNEDALYSRAICKVSVNDILGAIHELKKVLEINPDSDDAQRTIDDLLSVDYFDRGLEKYENGDLEGAQQDLRIAIELDSAYASSKYEDYFDEIDNEQAVADLTKIIEIIPDWPDAYYHRANHKYEISDPLDEIMIDLILSLKKSYDNNLTEYNNHAEIREGVKDFLRFIFRDILIHGLIDEIYTTEMVLNLIEQILEFCQDWDEPYFYRGYIKLGYLEDYQGAIYDFSRVIELSPESAYAYYNRGEANYKLQNYQQARTDYNTAIERNPNDVLDYYGDDGIN